MAIGKAEQMIKRKAHIQADLGEPILFRTTNADVYHSTLRTGALWLRSDQYYREFEDMARNDGLEGVNSGTTKIPLSLPVNGGPGVYIKGSGHIGQQIRPHYILSLHGTSISAEQRAGFGGCTFGVRNLSRLSAEVYLRAGSAAMCTGFRSGPVSYRYTSLTVSHSTIGSAAISFGGEVPLLLNPINTDVLVKHPVVPFIEQDEWRIVVFVDEYLNGDPSAPLRLQVDPSHFYEYPIDDN